MICFKQFTFTISLILPKGFLFRAFRRMRNFSPWNCPASQLHRCFAKEGPNSWSGAGGWCQGIIIQRVYCTKNCRMQLLGREEDWGCLWVGKFDSLRFDAWITGILKDHSKMVVSNISYVHPYLGRWSNLTNNFSDGLKPPPSHDTSSVNIGENLLATELLDDSGPMIQMSHQTDTWGLLRKVIKKNVKIQAGNLFVLFW